MWEALVDDFGPNEELSAVVPLGGTGESLKRIDRKISAINRLAKKLFHCACPAWNRLLRHALGVLVSPISLCFEPNPPGFCVRDANLSKQLPRAEEINKVRLSFLVGASG